MTLIRNYNKYLLLIIIKMLIQWKWAEAISVYPKNNLERKTLYPGNVYDVMDEVYNQLKNQYPDSIEIADDSDRTQVAEVIITFEEIRNLNTTPKQLVVAPWAWRVILVEKVVASIDYQSVAFATNLELEFRYDDAVVADWAGAEVTTASIDSLLGVTADTVSLINGLWQAETALTINKWLTAIVATWDPTDGDSDVKVKVYYKVISI